MGAPAGRRGMLTKAMNPPTTAAIRPGLLAQVGGHQGDEAGGEGGVEAVGLGVADGVAAEGPRQGPEVPEDEHRDAR